MPSLSRTLREHATLNLVSQELDKKLFKEGVVVRGCKVPGTRACPGCQRPISANKAMCRGCDEAAKVWDTLPSPMARHALGEAPSDGKAVEIEEFSHLTDEHPGAACPGEVIE